jgi:hypothetical protein
VQILQAKQELLNPAIVPSATGARFLITHLCPEK